MEIIEKKYFVGLILLIGIFITSIEKVHCESVTNIESDTYKITLEGSELNNVVGLNVTLSVENAEIISAVNFSSNGASALLSSVTNPSIGRYVISLVLNGKITDGKANISGEFLQNSVFSGAKVSVVDITREGGSSIKDLITSKITFSNSKATPTPTATPTATPSATPSSTQATTSTPSGTQSGEQTKEEIIEDIVNAIIDNLDNVNVEELTQNITDILENESNVFKISGSSKFLIKPRGINKYYIRMRGILDSKEQNAVVCEAHTRDDNYKLYNPISEEHYFPFNPEHLSIKNRIYFKFPNNGKKYRFDKRATITLIPNERGQKIYKGEETLNALYVIYCRAFHTEDPNLKTYLKEKNLDINNVTVDNIMQFVEEETKKNGKPYNVLEDIGGLVEFKSELVNPVMVGK